MERRSLKRRAKHSWAGGLCTVRRPIEQAKSKTNLIRAASRGLTGPSLGRDSGAEKLLFEAVNPSLRG